MRVIKKYAYYLLLPCLIVIVSFTPKPSETDLYIQAYSNVAIAEMQKSGIPASIKLAQGIHESNSGKSALAQKAKNHFGLKCKSYWEGNTYYHKDDDRNSKGDLIPSCFRSYDSVVTSYENHSEFLVNTLHYAELFLYSKHDYKNWAYGLKKCGYATDRLYAQKLISTIEKYDLHRFDKTNDIYTGKHVKIRRIQDTPPPAVRLPENYIGRELRNF